MSIAYTDSLKSEKLDYEKTLLKTTYFFHASAKQHWKFKQIVFNVGLPDGISCLIFFLVPNL